MLKVDIHQRPGIYKVPQAQKAPGRPWARQATQGGRNKAIHIAGYPGKRQQTTRSPSDSERLKDLCTHFNQIKQQ